jgi:HAD superfamily hydrolase (TIGR01509 family)
MPVAVIFDVDGTLVDSVDLHAEAWRRVLGEFGRDVKLSDVRAQIGKGGDELLKVFLSPDEIEKDGKTLDERHGALFKAEYMSQVRPFPGVRGLFEHLIARGHRIALGSSGKEDEVEHHKRLCGIEDLDLMQTTSEDAEKSKPHPDIFQAALKKLGVGPEQAVAVGDTPYDASAAGKAGIVAIGVMCGGFPADDLRGAGCVALYDGPADMLARYEGSPLDR